MTQPPQYVPMKAICEELTAFGFSYKWGGCSPIVQPWRLTEGKARKMGLLFEGDRAIRRFWEDHVRAKLPDEFYRRRNVDDMFWVDEARRLCGFDNANFKDRFAQTRKYNEARGVSAETLAAAAAAVAVGTSSTSSAAASSDPVTTAGNGTSVMRKVPQFSPLSSSSAPSVKKRKKEKISGEDAQKLKKKKKKKKENKEKEEGKVHYQELLRMTGRFPTTDTSKTSTGGTKSSRTTTATANSPLGERQPANKHTGQSGQSSSKECLPGASGDLPTKIKNAPWLQVKGRDVEGLDDRHLISNHIQEQAELFESLYARASILSDPELQKASVLLQDGDPKMIGVMKAYVGKESHKKELATFKRVLDTILSPASASKS